MTERTLYLVSDERVQELLEHEQRMNEIVARLRHVNAKLVEALEFYVAGGAKNDPEWRLARAALRFATEMKDGQS